MSALIPALIKLFMSRARGGGGGGRGGYSGGGRMPKPEKSAAEKDDEYWAKKNLSSSDGLDAFKAAADAAVKPMSWEQALNAFKK
jgi:hypothetical protein